MKQKDELTKEKKELEEKAAAKHIALLRKAKTVGNYVHESVPVSDNEVSATWEDRFLEHRLKRHRTTTLSCAPGPKTTHRHRNATASPTTKSSLVWTATTLPVALRSLDIAVIVSQATVSSSIWLSFNTDSNSCTAKATHRTSRPSS